MKNEILEVVRGSGNVFRDLKRREADAEQFKAILAAEIIRTLNREHLTVRAAHDRTGIAAADFSRIQGTASIALVAQAVGRDGRGSSPQPVSRDG